MSVRPLAVLLVDDSPDDQRQVQQVLGQVPFAIQLAVVDNAARALEVLRGQGEFAEAILPDVVLLDLELGTADEGRELLATIKDDPRTAGIPVVAMADYETDADASRSHELGVHGFVAKPLTPDEFIQVVTFTENVT